jgi:hypothetical protein
LQDLGNVVLHDSLKRGVGPDARANPRWKLRVPDQIVASDLLASGLGNVDNLLTAREGEAVLFRLSCIPLHGIAWGELTENVGVVEDGHVLGVRGLAPGNGNCSAEVDLALGYGSLAEVRSAIGTSRKCLAFFQRDRCRCCGSEGQ